MNRRGILASLIGAAASCFLGWRRDAHAEEPKVLRRVFRQNHANQWREIAWGEMRPGDEVLILDLHNGHLSSLDSCKVASFPIGAQGVIQVDAWLPLLVPRGECALCGVDWSEWGLKHS